MNEPEETMTHEVDVAPTYEFNWGTGEIAETSLDALEEKYGDG